MKIMERWLTGTQNVTVAHTGRTDGLEAEVCMALVDHLGRILVSRKSTYPEGAWRLPTGGILAGETPREAFFREMQEEVGLTGDDTEALHPVAEILYEDSTFASYLFVAELKAGVVVVQASDELESVKWVDLSELSFIAAALEQLDGRVDSALGRRDWRKWGAQRAVIHDVLEEFLLERFAQTEKIEVRLLGSVRVVRGDMVAQQSGKPALLLALLGLIAPRSASALDLYEAAWGVPAPEDERRARTAAEKELSRLRTMLGLSESQLKTHQTNRETPPRYQLQLETDLGHFRALTAKARELEQVGHIAEAIGALGEAIALWQGPVAGGVLSGADGTGLFAGVLEGLDAEFLEARIKILRLQLQEGNDHAVATQGAMLLGEEPFNEEVVEVVMLALYRSGQYVPSAQKFREYCGRLRREYATDPSAALVDLHQRILKRDPTLELPRKQAFTGQGGQELQMYWGYRPAAHHDIRESLLACRQRLVVAGQGVSTLSEILNDPEVLRALVTAHQTNPDLQITLVMANAQIPHRAHETGGQRLIEKTEAGLAALLQFQATFARRSGSFGVVDLRIYKPGFLVRHFFLRCDDSMYVGSYLSHVEGSRSYLMKLKNFEGGLFDMFDAELAHVLKHTTPLTND